MTQQSSTGLGKVEKSMKTGGLGFLARVKVQIAKEEAEAAGIPWVEPTLEPLHFRRVSPPSLTSAASSANLVALRWQNAAYTVRRASQLAQMFRPRNAQRALQSFVALQLVDVLQTVNPETDVLTGSTFPGAVLFSDASGFTKLTAQLAKEVCRCSFCLLLSN